MQIVDLSLKSRTGHSILLQYILQLPLKGGLLLIHVILALLDLIQQIRQCLLFVIGGLLSSLEMYTFSALWSRSFQLSLEKEARIGRRREVRASLAIKFMKILYPTRERVNIYQNDKSFQCIWVASVDYCELIARAFWNIL